MNFTLNLIETHYKIFVTGRILKRSLNKNLIVTFIHKKIIKLCYGISESGAPEAGGRGADCAF